MKLPQNSTIFVDTNIFIALENADDALHPQARGIWRQLETVQPKLYTSIFILSETLTILSLRMTKSTAVRFGNWIFSSDVLEVLRSDPKVENRAFAFFLERPSKNLGFVDCLSFALIERYEIPYVLTFDKDFHFEKAKFKVVP